jgi:TonB family protein
MIAYSMLYMAAFAAPIACAAWALSAVLRRYGRPERGVWIGGLILALTVPLLVLATSPDATGTAADATATGMVGLPEIIAVSEQSPPIGAGSYVVAVWVLLSVGLALRWAWGSCRLHLASRRWTPGTVDGVDVHMTEDVGPAVAGVFRPRILAPAWLTELPQSQRSLILMHEQEHIRAADPIVVAVARVARVLVPWNPVVLWLTSRLIRAIELDCDRRVLRKSHDVLAYGTTLLDISARRPGRFVAVAAFAESEAPLRNRILAMTTPPRAVSIAAICSSVVLGVILLLGALEIPVPAVRIQVEIGPSTSEPDRAVTRGTFQPSSTRPRLINEEEVRRVAELELERVMEQKLDLVETAPPQPRFTPASTEPVMLNRAEVARALLDTYPAALRDRGIGGTAILQLRVGTEGRVLDRRVQKSSGYADMDDAALRVVDMMRFQPARNRDQQVPVWVSQRATFVPGAPSSDFVDHHNQGPADYRLLTR